MSVTVIAHFHVADVAKAIEGLQANAALLEEITEDTNGAGILHHRFVAGDAELVVIDEWETAEQFQEFFEANPKWSGSLLRSVSRVLQLSRCTTRSTLPEPFRGLKGQPRAGRKPGRHIG